MFNHQRNQPNQPENLIREKVAQFLVNNYYHSKFKTVETASDVTILQTQKTRCKELILRQLTESHSDFNQKKHTFENILGVWLVNDGTNDIVNMLANLQYTYKLILKQGWDDAKKLRICNNPNISNLEFQFRSFHTILDFLRDSKFDKVIEILEDAGNSDFSEVFANSVGFPNRIYSLAQFFKKNKTETIERLCKAGQTSINFTKTSIQNNSDQTYIFLQEPYESVIGVVENFLNSEIVTQKAHLHINSSFNQQPKSGKEIVRILAKLGSS